MVDGLIFVIRSLIILGAVATVIALALLLFLWQEKKRNALARAHREAMARVEREAQLVMQGFDLWQAVKPSVPEPTTTSAPIQGTLKWVPSRRRRSG